MPNGHPQPRPGGRRLEGFHLMVKPVGPLCNLDCSYCFYLKKDRLYPDRQGLASWSMPPEVLQAVVEQTISSQGEHVHFTWQGGEPTLLGLPFFEQVVELQERFRGDKEIHNSLQTNGILLDNAWGTFLAKHRFLVGLSLDGPPELHDRWRVDRGGAPTHARVLAAAQLLARHGVEFNTLTVVHRDNARRAREVYDFLKAMGSQALQFIPLVERRENGEVAPWTVEAGDWGGFLCTIFDEWVAHDMGRLYVQLFEVALQCWLEEPASLCLFRETCGAALAMEHNGDLYSCDHFVVPENRLGNVMRQSMAWMVNSPQQRQFGRDKLELLPGQCRRCEVRFACHGECPKNRFLVTDEGEAGLNYLCAGYLRFFRYVDPAMRFMAQQVRQGGNPNLLSRRWSELSAPRRK